LCSKEKLNRNKNFPDRRKMYLNEYQNQQIVVCHEDTTINFDSIMECMETSITSLSDNDSVDELSTSNSSLISAFDSDTESVCEKSVSRNVRFNPLVSYDTSLPLLSDDNDDDHRVSANTLWYSQSDYQRFRSENKVLVRFAKAMLDSGCWYDDEDNDNDTFCIRGLEKKVWDDMRYTCRTNRQSAIGAVLMEQQRQRLLFCTPNDKLIRDAYKKYTEECLQTALTLGLNDETDANNYYSR
jgi:hypothetical protein